MNELGKSVCVSGVTGELERIVHCGNKYLFKAQNISRGMLSVCPSSHPCQSRGV